MNPERQLAVDKTAEGNDLYSVGEVAGALRLYREAYDLTKDAIAASNIATAMTKLGMFDEAMEWATIGFQGRPEDRRTRIIYGDCLLREGRWLEAWQHWFPLTTKNPVLGVGEEWTGQDLRGKEVLVVPAGGFGDVFLYARYIPEIAKRFGCRVSFSPTEDLVRVFLRQPSMQGVNMSEKRNWDIWMHMFQFPILFQMTPETVVWNGPYIEPIALGLNEKMRIGLKLGAGERDDVYRFRTLPGMIGEELIAAMPRDVQLIGLSQSNELVKDWLDTIALISTCDLVLSVDTAVLHLAAAMGKPTWALLGDFCDAKWGRAATTPWYPTMRIFRGEGKGYKHTVDQVIEAFGTWLLENRRVQCPVVTT